MFRLITKNTQSGFALVQVLIITLTLTLIEAAILFQTREIEQKLQYPRVKNLMFNIESKVKALGLTPGTYVGCLPNDISNCTINPTLYTSISDSCGPNCSVSVVSPSFDLTTRTLTAKIRVSGNFAIKDIEVRETIPTDVLTTNIIMCPDLNPIFEGLDSGANMSAGQLPIRCRGANPSSCGPGEYVTSVNAGNLAVNCGSLNANISCPSSQYLQSFQWQGLNPDGTPLFNRACINRKDPYNYFNYLPILVPEITSTYPPNPNPDPPPCYDVIESQKLLTITVAPLTCGTATGAGYYSDGTNAFIDFSLNSGYSISNWIGVTSGGGAGTTAYVTMNSDRHVIVNCRLNTAADGCWSYDGGKKCDQSGTCTTGLSASSKCLNASNQLVDVTSQCVPNNTGQCNSPLDSKQLTVNLYPDACGTITTSGTPPLSETSSVGVLRANYLTNNTATVVVTPSPKYKIQSWSNGSTLNSASVQMDSDKSLSVTCEATDNSCSTFYSWESWGPSITGGLTAVGIEIQNTGGPNSTGRDVIGGMSWLATYYRGQVSEWQSVALGERYYGPANPDSFFSKYDQVPNAICDVNLNQVYVKFATTSTNGHRYYYCNCSGNSIPPTAIPPTTTTIPQTIPACSWKTKVPAEDWGESCPANTNSPRGTMPTNTCTAGEKFVTCTQDMISIFDPINGSSTFTFSSTGAIYECLCQ